MTFLCVANALAVVTCIGAVLVRRHSFGSRWDAPLTAGIALYALASALDGPWPAIAAASHPLTGKYYLLNTLGHICYLAGNAAGVRSVLLRLLSDDELERFMKTSVVPIVGVASTIMLGSVLASPATSTMSANFLYAVPLDGWLRVYFTTFFLTMTATLWLAFFGGVRMRAEPPGAGAALPLMGTVSIGSIACLTFLAAILTGRSELIVTLWPIAYLATTAAALACAFSWRRRIADLTRPGD